MTNIDYRNANGSGLGYDDVNDDGNTIATQITRSALALPAVHMAGIEGFGIVTIVRNDRGFPDQFRWINPGYAGGPEFASGGTDALAWAIEDRKLQNAS